MAACFALLHTHTHTLPLSSEHRTLVVGKSARLTVSFSLDQAKGMFPESWLGQGCVCILLEAPEHDTQDKSSTKN